MKNKNWRGFWLAAVVLLLTAVLVIIVLNLLGPNTGVVFSELES